MNFQVMIRPDLKNVEGNTRVSRVQFGVSPNCSGANRIQEVQSAFDSLMPQRVSGATPETTRETRVLHRARARRGRWVASI